MVDYYRLFTEDKFTDVTNQSDAPHRLVGSLVAESVERKSVVTGS